MAGATAQELAVRTAVATVADTATLLQKVDSPGRLYAPLTKTQLRIDLGVVDSFLELGDTPAAYDSADIGRALIVKDDLSGLEFTDFNSDNWDSAYSWGDHAGLYDATGTAASTMTTHLGNFAHGDISLNTTHRGLTSGNPHSVTPTELGLGIGDEVEFTTITVNQGTINSSPGSDTGIATKGYVDNLGGGGSTFWTSVTAATIENINLSTDLESGDLIDGWALVTGDRVLVKDQTDATQNGLYTVVASGAASRSTDADTADEIISRKCIVLHGSTNEDKLFFCATAPITLGVTNIEFSSLAGGGAYGIIELLGEEYETGSSWESPTSVQDVDARWTNEDSSIDGSLATSAGILNEVWAWGPPFVAPLVFTVPSTECSKVRFYVEGDTYGGRNFRIRAHYYDGSWNVIGDVDAPTTAAWVEFLFGSIKTITQVKLDVYWPGQGGDPYEVLQIFEAEYEDISSTAQYKITLVAGTPTTDFIITFPDTDGDTDQVMISDGAGVLSWAGHDDLADFEANEHFLQTAITNVSTVLSTGLLKVTTGSGALTVISDSSGNWNGAYDHSIVTHDYSYISGNDGATDVTAAELEELSNGSETTLHSHAGGTFLALTDTPSSYDSADIGKVVKVKDDLTGLEFAEEGAGAHTIASHSDTTTTGAELEELTDGSQTILHSHAGGGGTFLDLADTPASYDSGDIGKYVKIKDDLSGLEFVTPSATASFSSRFSAHPSSEQTITQGDWAKVLFGTELYDNDNEFASSRYTATATGYYRISTQVRLLSIGADVLVYLEFRKNVAGTVVAYTIIKNDGGVYLLEKDLYLEANDYLEVWIYWAGSNRNTDANDYFTWFTGHRFA